MYIYTNTLSIIFHQQYLPSDNVLFFFNLQERLFVIPLADIESMRAIPAKKKGKAPAVDIYFGNPSRPKKITINLQQVKQLEILAIFSRRSYSQNIIITIFHEKCI